MYQRQVAAELVATAAMFAAARSVLEGEFAAVKAQKALIVGVPFEEAESAKAA